MIAFCEVRPHVLEERPGDGGRKIAGLSDQLSSSTKPGGIFGGSTPSLALQSGHGILGAPRAT
jgi:hypothetical protein